MKTETSYSIYYKNKLMDAEFFTGKFDDLEKTMKRARKLKEKYDVVRVVEEVLVTKTICTFSD